MNLSNQKLALTGFVRAGGRIAGLARARFWKQMSAPPRAPPAPQSKS